MRSRVRERSHITSADRGEGRRFVLILTFVIFSMGNNSNLADEGGGGV